MEQNNLPPTYAENLLHHAGFNFQLRSGQPPLNFGRIASVDIGQIVNDVDLAQLNKYVEEIAFYELNEEEMKLHSDATYVKLFQLAQLIIEYLLDVQSTLSANLNGLAKKYAAKKREIEKLSQHLANADSQIAALKDDLFYTNKRFRENLITKVPVINNASHYPTQERRPTALSVSGPDPSTLEELSSDGSNGDADNNKTIRLHIVSSSHALYLQLKVDPSLTILNLKNKLSSRLLLQGNCSIDFQEYSLYHKDEELNDSSQSLEDCHIGNDDAIVLSKRRVATDDVAEPEPQEVQDVVSHNNLSNIESKLEEILSAIHALQDAKGAKQPIEAQANTAATANEAPMSKQNSPLSKLGQLMEMEESENDVSIDAAESSSSSSESSKDLLASIESDGVAENTSSGDTSSNVDDVVQFIDLGDRFGLNLDTDTTAVHEIEDRPPSEIEVTTSDDTSSHGYLPNKSKVRKEVVAENIPNDETLDSSGLNYSMSEYSSPHSVAAVEDDKEDHPAEEYTPTPSKGILDRSIPLDEGVGVPSVQDMDIMPPIVPYPPSSKSKASWQHGYGQQFHFSELESLEGGEEDDNGSLFDGGLNPNDTIDYPHEEEDDDDDYNNIPPATNLRISSAKQHHATMDSTGGASDLQSIEISFSEFVPNAEEEEKKQDHAIVGEKKKFGCFSFLLKKRGDKKLSTKKPTQSDATRMMLPKKLKWNKSKKYVREGIYIYEA